VPLAVGVHRQYGFTYELLHSPVAPGGWRFEHDPLGGWLRFDMAAAPAETDDFLAMHAELSTTRFARVVTAQRRQGSRLELLRGCVYTEVDHGRATAVEVAGAAEWWELVIDGFGLSYGDLTAAGRDDLWRHVRTVHEEWEAAGRP